MNKYLLLSVVGIMVMLGFLACDDQEAPHNNAPVLAIGNATVGGRTTASLSGSITLSGGSEIVECGFIYSTVSTLPENESMVMPIDPSTLPGTCTVELTGLQPATHYYYCLYASSGYTVLRSEVREFDTAADGVPVYAEVTCTDITATSVTLHGELTDDGGYDILTQGFCYRAEDGNQSGIPDQEDMVVNVDAEERTFTVTLKDLQPETTYSVCAYGVNREGTGYGPATTFVTQASDVPMLSAITPVDSTNLSVTVEARVTDEGQAAVTEAGFCWSTESREPTTDMNHEACDALPSGSTPFRLLIDDLQPETVYYIRAYAVNEHGTGYGPTYCYRTKESSLALVETLAADEVEETTARLRGRILTDGGSSVTNKGFYYGTDPDPVSGGTRCYVTDEGDDLVYLLENLRVETTYYYCAYAENANGMAYGEVMSFTTAGHYTVPTVTTAPVTEIAQTTATFTGSVVADGGRDVSVTGFCYGITPNPAEEGVRVESVSGGDSFSYQATGLSASTHYYVCAYAVNEAGTGYGEVVEFTTDILLDEPTVGSTSVTDITSATASVSAEVLSDGGSEVTERGFYYGLNNPPTASDTKVVSTATGTAITDELTGLAPSTRYYIRAYAVNAQGTAMGPINVFTTADDRTNPSVGSVTASNITENSADLLATILSNGGAEIVEKGFCYTTDASVTPDTSSNKVVATNAGDDIALTLTGLAPETTYYIRAYASNGVRTGYSETIVVTTTSVPEPDVPETPGVPGIDDNVSPER